MILIIDNYDSFVYNLRDYVGSFGFDVLVLRNDIVTVKKVRELCPSHIILSPGPCTPEETGNCKEIIKRLGGEIPILGVCLGHQTIGAVFGSAVVRAKKVMHGKTSEIFFKKHRLFSGISGDSFTATRYHSLVVERVPSGFEEIAWCFDEVDGKKEKVIMGIADDTRMVYGLQFHPESILTKEGKRILKNFLELS